MEDWPYKSAPGSKQVLEYLKSKNIVAPLDLESYGNGAFYVKKDGKTVAYFYVWDEYYDFRELIRYCGLEPWF